MKIRRTIRSGSGSLRGMMGVSGSSKCCGCCDCGGSAGVSSISSVGITESVNCCCGDSTPDKIYINLSQCNGCASKVEMLRDGIKWTTGIISCNFPGDSATIFNLACDLEKCNWRLYGMCGEFFQSFALTSTCSPFFLRFSTDSGFGSGCCSGLRQITVSDS